jgi:protein phosphatase 1 regulatory subunit 7
MSSLRNLRLLSIQSNRIVKIEGLEELVNLEELYLSHNGIEVLEGLEKNVGCQSNFLSSYCVILFIHLSLLLQTKLTMLDVSNNRLKKLENIAHLLNLEEFWGNHNQFASYPDIETQLSPAKSLKTVYFEGNPLADDPQYRLKLKLMLPSIVQIDATYIRPA